MMLNRLACGLATALVASVLAGCTGARDAPTSPSPPDASTTAGTPRTAPDEHQPAPGESVAVTWVAIAPAADGDSAFAVTIDQLADIGYDVAPMPVSCQERVMLSLGLEDDPTARGVALVFDDLETSTAFSEVWTGDIVGVVEGPLLCDVPQG